ncbi:glycoside hydrolase family 1 protein [Aplosporella prunicola CBS 121167]|uniref:Glycoside hydrolase family 1 protein n=1 Tax=Aplosporella prunicola CBS 121167 TaxID=1176127 RepID=A0A6A6AV91_9PEZI|nr:glycoside hydrolase family 1 protein [Aplosporella prunicola CBS 121167]KAF2135506.1 glycoside hydrolase family 1 protein [Aplosporella prunicola CBS 121167]
MKSTPILLLCCAMQSLAQSSTTASGCGCPKPSNPTETQPHSRTADMWNMWIGAVSMAAVNTTVSPTAVASAELIPPPPQHYASWMRGPQSPAVHANASWRFPRAFWWGVAGASYQVEGAVKDEGRGPSVWDALLHRVEGYSMANETGDVTANHYYYYKQDIARLAALRVPYYSFSISWSRILPFGRGPVNEDGLAHYEDVINTCLEYGVKPAVTLFHWDLPLYLYNLYGGWTSEEIVDDFVEYARIILTRYGNKVPMWYTLNEPISFCTLQMPEHYFKNVTIPKKQQPYFCGQHALLAHSKVYHLAKSLNITGPISLKNNGYYKVARTNSTEDAKAVQRAWDFNEGWFANPIYVDGEYPRYLKEYVGTFLRELTAEEKAQIQNSTDFFAHDAYAAKMYMAPSGGIDACVTNESHALFPTCADSTFTYADEDGGWNIGPAADPYTAWLHKATDWIPQFLHYIQDTWHPAGGIAVTEFGFTEPYEARKWLLGDIRADLGRTTYFHDYLEAVLIALSEGVNVVGCLAWSVFDNLEWTAGFNVQFGLQYVNRTTQQRHYKASFFELARMFETYQEK